jgi:hypothetical protein
MKPSNIANEKEMKIHQSGEIANSQSFSDIKKYTKNY